MKKWIQIITLLTVVLSTGFLSYKLAFYIGEKFFFDKLFYQKSSQLGYVKQLESWTAPKFSDRNSSLLQLIAESKSASNGDAKVLGAHNSGAYRIAVIGDSYVWGQGISNEERFVNILQDKLSKIRRTEVVSLARCGDSIFDNYLKYTQIQKLQEHYDLYIFGMVNNDLIFSEGDSYDEQKQQEILRACPSGPVAWDNDIKTQPYTSVVERSFDPTSRNYCAFQNIIPQLPKEHAIYYNFEDFKYNWKSILTYSAELEKAGLTVLSSGTFFKNHQQDYTDFWVPNGFDRFQVSPKDGHPSALANKMYADQLYDEITRNKKWLFIQN